jgi:hypothetical protein
MSSATKKPQYLCAKSERGKATQQRPALAVPFQNEPHEAENSDEHGRFECSHENQHEKSGGAEHNANTFDQTRTEPSELPVVHAQHKKTNGGGDPTMAVLQQ